MFIAGFTPVTLVDFPGKIASTIFTKGCNLRCRFCHNPELVLPVKLPDLYDDVMAYLDAKPVENVVITGGEPLMAAGIESFVQMLNERNIQVKLDTNGTHPKKLKKLVDNKFLSYVAMDVKGLSQADLDYIGRSKFRFDTFLESVSVLKAVDVPVELRLTLWRSYEQADVEMFKKQIGDVPLVVQEMRLDGKVLDKGFDPVRIDFQQQKELFESVFEKVSFRSS